MDCLERRTTHGIQISRSGGELGTQATYIAEATGNAWGPVFADPGR
jgi:hypothetical protein